MNEIMDIRAKITLNKENTQLAWNRLRPDSNAFSHIKRLQH